MEVGGLTLARLGRLLPAVVSATVNPGGSPALRDAIATGAALSVTSTQIDELAGNVDVRVTQVSEGMVPLAEAEYARFVFFREAHGLLGHVAVLVGQQEEWPDPVPVRIHSACLTGDLFGSLRCDCGEQLRGSLRHIAKSGGGVLLYMSQEGRDIGLANKLRAYTLQEHGLDTVDADGVLGFGADEREYVAAVEMLKAPRGGQSPAADEQPGEVGGAPRGGHRRPGPPSPVRHPQSPQPAVREGEDAAGRPLARGHAVRRSFAQVVGSGASAPRNRAGVAEAALVGRRRSGESLDPEIPVRRG